MDFKGLPKVELHRHLEGSVRFDTFLELAKETGIDLPRAELRRRTSMKGEKPGFLRFLSKFELYRGLYPSRDWVERVDGLQQIGRNGLHRYNNSDHSMLTAMRAVENLVKGKSHDLWAVNAESVYHEEDVKEEHPYREAPETPAMQQPVASET